MIISPPATAPQPEQPSDSLPISACLCIDASHYLLSLYKSTLSALPSCSYSCGNMLWQKQQCTATHIHTYCTSHTCRQPLPSSLYCGSHLPTNRHMNTNTHTSAPAIKHFWSWARAHSKGRLSDESRQGSEESERQMSKSKQCKMVSLHSESYQEPRLARAMPKDIRVVFLSEDNDCVSLWKMTKKIWYILCYMCSWLARQLSVPKDNKASL